MRKNLIGGRLKRRRLELRLSPEDVSRRLARGKCAMSAAKIMAIEQRQVPVYDVQVLALAHVLKVSTHWLVTGREFRK